MKKRPLPLISLVLFAIGLSLVFLGTVLFFIGSTTPITSIVALGLLFVSLVGVYIIIKVFLLVDKLDKGKLIEDKKPIYVFCIVYLLILLLALLLLLLYADVSPKEKIGKDLVVIVAEEPPIEEEYQEDELIDYTQIPLVVDPIPFEEFHILLPEEKQVVEELEIIEEIVEPEIAEDILSEELESETVSQSPIPYETEAVPPEPIIAIVEEVVVPPRPTFIAQEEVLVPEAPSIISVEKELVPSVPSFITPERVLVPSTPEIISVESTLIPETPVFMEPIRTLVEEKPVSAVVQDPWADFYISGDSFDLYDGIYWFDLYINGSPVGAITVNIENGEASLYYPELKDYSIPYLTEEAQKRIFGEEREWIDSMTLSSLGVEVYIDTFAYSVEVEFNAEDMPMGIISIKGSNSISQPRPISGATLLTSAKWYMSSSLSFSASISSLEKEDVLSRLRVSLQSSSNLRIGDTYGRFTWSAGYSGGSTYINWGSYYFWKDFESQLLAVSAVINHASMEMARAVEVDWKRPLP